MGKISICLFHSICYLDTCFLFRVKMRLLKHKYGKVCLLCLKHWIWQKFLSNKNIWKNLLLLFFKLFFARQVWGKNSFLFTRKVTFLEKQKKMQTHSLDKIWKTKNSFSNFSKNHLPSKYPTALVGNVLPYRRPTRTSIKIQPKFTISKLNYKFIFHYFSFPSYFSK